MYQTARIVNSRLVRWAPRRVSCLRPFSLFYKDELRVRRRHRSTLSYSILRDANRSGLELPRLLDGCGTYRPISWPLTVQPLGLSSGPRYQSQNDGATRFDSPRKAGKADTWNLLPGLRKPRSDLGVALGEIFDATRVDPYVEEHIDGFSYWFWTQPRIYLI